MLGQLVPHILQQVLDGAVHGQVSRTSSWCRYISWEGGGALFEDFGLYPGTVQKAATSFSVYQASGAVTAKGQQFLLLTVAQTPHPPFKVGKVWLYLTTIATAHCLVWLQTYKQHIDEYKKYRRKTISYWIIRYWKQDERIGTAKEYLYMRKWWLECSKHIEGTRQPRDYI